ncbi:MAG: GNAT family N-acetyltransferase [Bacteroidota bacterium]
MIVTQRLKIKEFQLRDAAFVLELVNTPAWLKYIGDRAVYSVADAEKYLCNRLIASYATHGFGFYNVWHIEQDCPIGMCGLVKRDHLECPDLGFAFLPDFVGKGYAFEASQAVLDFAKQQLKLVELCAITLPDNLPSNGLLKKLGFELKEHIQLPDDEEELSLYQKLI